MIVNMWEQILLLVVMFGIGSVTIISFVSILMFIGKLANIFYFSKKQNCRYDDMFDLITKGFLTCASIIVVLITTLYLGSLIIMRLL